MLAVLAIQSVTRRGPGECPCSTVVVTAVRTADSKWRLAADDALSLDHDKKEKDTDTRSNRPA